MAQRLLMCGEGQSLLKYTGLSKQFINITKSYGCGFHYIKHYLLNFDFFNQSSKLIKVPKQALLSNRNPRLDPLPPYSDIFSSFHFASLSSKVCCTLDFTCKHTSDHTLHDLVLLMGLSSKFFINTYSEVVSLLQMKITFFKIYNLNLNKQ